MQASAPAAPQIRLYQVAYSPETLAAVEEGYLALDNLANERPDWFEYWPIRRFLIEEPLDDDAYYGFFSPKFRVKTGLSHAQVCAFVRTHAGLADVMLFSPQPDMGAFFLNVFEQGETFDPGLIAAYDAFLAHIGRPTPLRELIMDSRQIVFSNYFVARAAFWRAWLEVNEAMLAICEGAASPLREALCHPTSYHDVQRKVFLQERAASLLLATQPRWRSVAHNPFGMGWSVSRFREYPTEAIVSDALKVAYREQPHPEYLQTFYAVRAHFRSGTSAPLPYFGGPAPT